MLFLRVYDTTATLGEVAEGLEQHGSARHVILAEGVRPGHALLTAEVHPESADPVLEFLHIEFGRRQSLEKRGASEHIPEGFDSNIVGSENI